LLPCAESCPKDKSQGHTTKTVKIGLTTAVDDIDKNAPTKIPSEAFAPQSYKTQASNSQPKVQTPIAQKPLT